MIPFWYDYCEFSDHDVYDCPYHDYVDARCASLGKKIHELTDKMIETIKEILLNILIGRIIICMSLTLV